MAFCLTQTTTMKKLLLLTIALFFTLHIKAQTQTCTISASSQSVCAGGVVTLTVNVAPPTTGYTWSAVSGLSTTTNSVVSNTPTAPSTIYTVTLANGTVCTATINVTPVPHITVTTTGTTVTCAGTTATLSATGASSYTFSSGATAATTVVTPTVTTTYTVTGLDNGCTATNTITVNVGPKLAINASVAPNTTLPVTLTANGGSTATGYTWTPNSFLSATTGTTVVANPTATTIYTVTSSNTCNATYTVTIGNVLPPGIATMLDSINNHQDTVLNFCINKIVNVYYYKKNHPFKTKPDSSIKIKIKTIQFDLNNGTISNISITPDTVNPNFISGSSNIININRNAIFNSLIQNKIQFNRKQEVNLDFMAGAHEKREKRIRTRAYSMPREWSITTIKPGNTTERNKYRFYLFANDAIKLKPFVKKNHTFPWRLDIEYANYYFSDSAKTCNNFIREKNVDSYFNIDIATDLLGLLANNNPNGKFQTRISGKFNVFSSQAGVSFFQTIHPYVMVANFSQADENIIQVSSTKPNKIEGIHAMQLNRFNAGFDIDLMTIRFRSAKIFTIMAGSRAWLTPFDSIHTSGGASTVVNFNVLSRSYEIGANLHSRANTKIKWEIGARLIDFRILTSNTNIMQTNYSPISYNKLTDGASKADYINSLIFSPYFYLYYSPKGSKTSNVFFKMAFPYQVSRLNAGAAYFQVQVGYTVSITKFLKSVGKK